MNNFNTGNLVNLIVSLRLHTREGREVKLLSDLFAPEKCRYTFGEKYIAWVATTFIGHDRVLNKQRVRRITVSYLDGVLRILSRNAYG